jgi:hypothetical protein
MSAIKSQHSRIFERLMGQQRQEVLESLAMGHETSMYWRLVGQIQGIDDALKISEKADSVISGDEPEVER